MVFQNQQSYYDAISASNHEGQSGPSIDFMLGEILNALKSHQGERLDVDENLTEVERRFEATFGEGFGVKFSVKFGENDMRLLLLLHSSPGLSASKLAERIGISQRGVEKQIKKLREIGILSRRGSAKNGLWQVDIQKTA